MIDPDTPPDQIRKAYRKVSYMCMYICGRGLQFQNLVPKERGEGHHNMARFHISYMILGETVDSLSYIMVIYIIMHTYLSNNHCCYSQAMCIPFSSCPGHLNPAFIKDTRLTRWLLLVLTNDTRLFPPPPRMEGSYKLCLIIVHRMGNRSFKGKYESTMYFPFNLVAQTSGLIHVVVVITLLLLLLCSSRSSFILTRTTVTGIEHKPLSKASTYTYTRGRERGKDEEGREEEGRGEEQRRSQAPPPSLSVCNMCIPINGRGHVLHCRAVYGGRYTADKQQVPVLQHNILHPVCCTGPLLYQQLLVSPATMPVAAVF